MASLAILKKTCVVAIRPPGVGLFGHLPTGTIGKLDAPRLTVIDLSFNSFTGNIPPTIHNLVMLTVLNLERNMLSGTILGLDLPRVRLLNLSHNNLSGSIPTSLHKFPSSSSLGNSLCGPPLGECHVSGPSPSHSLTYSVLLLTSPQKTGFGKKKLSTVALAAIVICGAITLLLVIVVLLVCCLRGEYGEHDATDKGKASGIYNFNLEDLLRASIEVLGKVSYGTVYKAILDEGMSVVVKRLKEVGTGKREFEQQMEDLLSLVMLPKVSQLFEYECGGQDNDYCKCCDCGLTMLMNFHAITPRTVGYHAPEVFESRKAAQKSNVYSFGVLLLEMLTGKAPLKSHGKNDVVDLPRIQIAQACVARIPDMRPRLDEVRMIEDIRQPKLDDRLSSEKNKSKESNVCTPNP
ncbi:hypothetical protein Ancab_034611 [Ancistrocladus abbreviatus]